MASPNNNRQGGPPMSPSRGTPMSPSRGTPMSPSRGTPMSPSRGTPTSPSRGTPMSPSRGTPMSPFRGINLDGASDAPSRGGSQHGGSTSGAPSSAPPARPGYPAPMGFDPAKPKGVRDLAPMTPTERVNKRCELPAEAYQDLMVHHTPFAKRPGFATTGEKIRVSVNQFRVKALSAGDIYQYDISLSPSADEHPAVYQKVWDSLKAKGERSATKAPWLYDGRKLAWSTANLGKEMRFMVDLDAEQGKTPRPNSTRPPNQWFLIIKPTGAIRMAALKGYLEGNSSWDNSVLECMSFLDHVLRQGPSERMKLIKRTFINNASETFPLNNYTEAIKGIYSTIRLNETINSGGTGLGVNVDVSNQTFWVGQKFEQLVRNYLASLNRAWSQGDYRVMSNLLKPVKKVVDGKTRYEQSDAFKALRKLHNIRFEVQHRGKSQCTKEYKVKRFTFDKEKGEQTARTITFVKREKNGTERTMSIMQYYQSQYNATLQWPDLPLIETSRAGFFPFEVCEVQRFNPYPFKLDPQQTQQMIKFAVQRPPQRKGEIEKMVANLNWAGDRYLHAFKIAIDPKMALVPATVIKNPELQFHPTSAKKGKLNPMVSGRWDLRGLKFLKTNKDGPLISWAFVALDGCVDSATLKNFYTNFKQAFQAHGASVQTDPQLFNIPKQEDLGVGIQRAFNETGRAFKKTPQIIFFVVPDKSSVIYERLKKSADCRFAFPSQVLQAGNVRKAAPQYCSNVCLKVNAKLGGATSTLTGDSFFGNTPTMIIGADVSHASPGSPQASMAAICASIDKDAIRYRAAVQTNGYRTEIISQSNIQSIIPDMVNAFGRENKCAPKQIFYFRDGVSEGQFAHVMEHEAEEFKRQFEAKGWGIPKITVIVATKRHHIRFFPEKGDRNGNPLPGTLVEREVTHPFHYDFYLCSHVAIQGTARPVHYNVIHDEINWPADKLQKMIYHHCYQYCRATTPVSLHPAVYYAHLASNRARAHENISFTDKNPQQSAKGSQAGGWGAKQDTNTTTSGPKGTEAPPLLPMGGLEARPDCRENIRNTMWWI